MTDIELRGVTIITGGAAADHDVRIRPDGTLAELGPPTAPPRCRLMAPLVDLHLDVIVERRRPRATVELDLDSVVVTLDAEVAAAGIGVVCVGARCEEEPGNGIRLTDAAELARAIGRQAHRLASDWRVHARVEVADEGSVEALEEVLAAGDRVALISMMEHTAQRSRFASKAEHVAFYAEDWGLPVAQVEEIMLRKRRGTARSDERRDAVAAVARRAGIPLATHDDRDAAQVRAGHALGAAIAEFPLTLDAARTAVELGMTTVLGAPNVVRRRSTSPGNLLAADAIGHGVLDALCSDYLPAALLHAPVTLAADGIADLPAAARLVSTNAGAAIGVPTARIEVDAPLDAILIDGAAPGRCVAMWAAGRLRYATVPALDAWSPPEVALVS